MIYDGGNIITSVDGSGINYSNSNVSISEFTYNTLTTNYSFYDTRKANQPNSYSDSPYFRDTFTGSFSGAVLSGSEAYISSGFIRTHFPKLELGIITSKTNLSSNKLFDFSWDKSHFLKMESGDGLKFVKLTPGTHSITGTNIINGDIYSANINESLLTVPVERLEGRVVVNPTAENALLVYNTRSPQSVDLMHYYTGQRIGLKGIHILGIDCFSGEYGEITNTGEYVREIREPIFNYIRSNNKIIKYCILMYGVPYYITGEDVKQWGDSSIGSMGFGYRYSGAVQHDLSRIFYYDSGYCRYPSYQYDENDYLYLYRNAASSFYSGLYGQVSSLISNDKSQVNPASRSTERYLHAKNYKQTFLVSHIWGDTAADVSGYIKKITTDGVVDGPYLHGNQKATGAIICEASSDGFSSTQFNAAYLKLNGHYTGQNNELNYITKSSWTTRLAGVTGNSTDHDPYTTGKDVGLLFTWGIHTAHANGPGDTDDWSTIQYTDNIVMTGDYNWFVTCQTESYGHQNRILPGLSQSYWFNAPWKQFAETAYYGTGYSKIPIGSIGAVIEPGVSYFTHSNFVESWISGFPFIEAAYSALDYAPGSIVFGDPFLKY